MYGVGLRKTLASVMFAEFFQMLLVIQSDIAIQIQWK